jgi:hypothetical protein
MTVLGTKTIFTMNASPCCPKNLGALNSHRTAVSAQPHPEGPEMSTTTVSRVPHTKDHEGVANSLLNTTEKT